MREERGRGWHTRKPSQGLPAARGPQSARSPSLQPGAPVISARSGPFLGAPRRHPGPRPTRRPGPLHRRGRVGGLPDWPAARPAFGAAAGRRGARRGSEGLLGCSATRGTARPQRRPRAARPRGDYRRKEEGPAPGAPRPAPGLVPPLRPPQPAGPEGESGRAAYRQEKARPGRETPAGPQRNVVSAQRLLLHMKKRNNTEVAIVRVSYVVRVRKSYVFSLPGEGPCLQTGLLNAKI